LVFPIIAYTLSSTKLEMGQNSFCLVRRGYGKVKEGVGEREVAREGVRNDPNIVCTYE
jgi:hypothetical protein